MSLLWGGEFGCVCLFIDILHLKIKCETNNNNQRIKQIENNYWRTFITDSNNADSFEQQQQRLTMQIKMQTQR